MWCGLCGDRLTFSTADQEMLHHVNVAIRVTRPSDVPRLPKDVAKRCHDIWHATHEGFKSVHEPLAASLRRVHAAHNWRYELRFGYSAWVAVMRPLPFVIDVDTPHNYIAGVSYPPGIGCSVVVRSSSQPSPAHPTLRVVDVRVRFPVRFLGSAAMYRESRRGRSVFRVCPFYSSVC